MVLASMKESLDLNSEARHTDQPAWMIIESKHWYYKNKITVFIRFYLVTTNINTSYSNTSYNQIVFIWIAKNAATFIK